MGGVRGAGDERYLTPAEEERQAGWYAGHRRELYRQLGLRQAASVLEVGCGTGVVAAEMAALGARVVGLDRRPEALAAAAARDERLGLIAGEATRLPFKTAAFDAVVTAFTLMWLEDVGAFLKEAGRVLKDGGVFVALAEPDYEATIDYPPAASSRELVAAAVRRMGGEPAAGRRLPGWLAAAGFELWKFGVLNSAWAPARWAAEEEREFELLRRWLGADADDKLKRARQAAIERGERLYFLPIFYAAAKKTR